MTESEVKTWTVEDHLIGQPEYSIALYNRFVDLLQQCGDFTYAVSKTTVTFKGTRRGFAGARPTKKGLQGYLDLQREVRDRRIRNVSPYTRKLFVHHFLVANEDDLDEEFRGWMREAYDVGAGGHL